MRPLGRHGCWVPGTLPLENLDGLLENIRTVVYVNPLDVGDAEVICAEHAPVVIASDEIPAGEFQSIAGERARKALSDGRL